MIPRIAARGHSFQGASQYYLHDKKSHTSERVGWTQTRNMPVRDPHAATDWMAYTAMNSDKLKQEAGVKATGRKQTRGAVFSYSLSWHPQDKPDKEQMLKAVDQTLDKLGLEEHEALIVRHTDEEHPHVHVICNLVNPNDGRLRDPDWGSKLKLSEWALQYEQEHNRIDCEQRVINQAQRKQGQFVKHQEARLTQAEEIQKLYQHSDNGQAFQAALDEAGYTLAKGDRRGFVIVDHNGEISSLSRQLKKPDGKGMRAKDVRNFLSDVKQEELPQASKLADERKHFDREQYNRDQEEKLIEAAIKADEKRELIETERQKAGDSRTPKPNIQQDFKHTDPIYDEEHLVRLDAILEWERKADRQRRALKERLANYYEFAEHEEVVAELREKQEKKNNWWGRLTGQHKRVSEELEAESMSLEGARQRAAEQEQALEVKLQQSRKGFEKGLERGDHMKKYYARKAEQAQQMKDLQQRKDLQQKKNNEGFRRGR